MNALLHSNTLIHFQIKRVENNLPFPKGQISGSFHNKCILEMTKSKCHDPNRKNNKLTGKFIIAGRTVGYENDLWN